MTNAATTSAPAPRSSAPGRIWYVVAFTLFIAGFGVMAAIIFSRIGDAADRMIRIVVPGTGQLTLDRPGTYTIFHEHRSALDGQVYAVDGVSGLHLSVRSNETRELLPLRSNAGGKYSFGGYAGRSLFDFDIETPGIYEVAASYADGRAEPKTVIAIDHGFIGDIVLTVLLALAASFTGAGLATTIAVVVFLKRRKAFAARL